jgi:hypothetical protein
LSQRKAVLSSIVTAKSTDDVTWIFTGSHSPSSLGNSSAMDYLNAALVRGSPFISIVLHCELDENLQRVVGGDRGESNTKLTDPAVLRSIRETQDVFLFKDGNELELDVTRLSPGAAAATIYDHVI